MRYVWGVLIFLGVVGALEAQLPPDAIVWETTIPGTVDVITVANLKGGYVDGDTAKWQKTLEDIDRDVSYCPQIQGDSVVLDFSISLNGNYRVIAYSPSGDTLGLMILLTWPRGCMASWELSSWWAVNDTVPALYDVRADFLTGGTNLSPLMIEAVARLEFGQIVESLGYAGPVQTFWYDWRTMSVDSVHIFATFGKPIWVVNTVLYHAQSPGDWMWRELRVESNSRFSVAPQWVWDFPLHAERGFRYALINPSFRLIAGSGYSGYWLGESFVAALRILNEDTLVQSPTNWPPTRYNFTTNVPDHAEVVMRIVSDSIDAVVSAQLVALADSISIPYYWEMRDSVVNPQGSWDQNPPPMVLRIDSQGAVGVEDKIIQGRISQTPVLVSVQSKHLIYRALEPVNFLVLDRLGRRIALRRSRNSGVIYLPREGLYFWHAGNRSGKVLILNTH